MSLSKSGVKRIGVLTAGGDCPGLNAVVRAVTKTAIFDYGMEVIGFKDGFYGVVMNLIRRLDVEDVSGILTAGGTILGTSNRHDPFNFLIEKNGKVIKKDYSGRAIQNLKKHGIDALVCIGGDGTLHITKKMQGEGVNVVGVPKTIDNDVSETDYTFGFDTAVQTATEAIDKIHDTAMSHHRVMIVEVMGRYVGWLALYAGVASGGDVILIPEIPYDANKVCDTLKRRSRRGKRFSIIVAAEGAVPVGGKFIIGGIDKTSPEPIRLGGIGRFLSGQLREKTALEMRVTVLGHIQRGGTPTAFDRALATRFGAAATQAVADGDFGKVVCLKGTEIVRVPIEKTIGELKKVPLDHQLIKAARSVGTDFGD